jgi:hypothetical protein
MRSMVEGHRRGRRYRPLRMRCAHRPLRAGEVLAGYANLKTSLRHGETGLRSKPERLLR